MKRWLPGILFAAVTPEELEARSWNGKNYVESVNHVTFKKIIQLEAARREAEIERDRIYELLLQLRGEQTMFLNQRLEKLSLEINVVNQQIEAYHRFKAADSTIYTQVEVVVDQLNSFGDLLAAHPDDRGLQRQAIIANVRTIEQQSDEAFHLYYNYSSANGQVWLPRQESNLD